MYRCRSCLNAMQYCGNTLSLQPEVVKKRESFGEIVLVRIQWNLSNTDTLGPIKCVLVREVFSFHGANNTYLYEVGTWSSVLIKEASLVQGCQLRGVPLYMYLHSMLHLLWYPPPPLPHIITLHPQPEEGDRSQLITIRFKWNREVSCVHYITYHYVSMYMYLHRQISRAE